MNLVNTYVDSENKELLKLYLTEASKQGYTWCDGTSLGSLGESYAIVEGWVEYAHKDMCFEYYIKFAIGKLGKLLLLVSCHMSQ